MSRKIRNVRNEEELSEFANSFPWSESEDDWDFSADNSDEDPDFDFSDASRKWTNRLFYHMCDMAMINAWILYKRHHAETNQNENEMALHEFVSEVAQCLTKSGRDMKNGRGRRSSLEMEIAAKRQRPMSGPLPPLDIRLDNVEHLPEFVKEGKPRCKNPNCTSRSKIR